MRDALYTVTVVRDCVQRETDEVASAVSRYIHIHGSSVNRVYDSKPRRYAEDYRTCHNRIVRTGKFEVEVTNNQKKTALEEIPLLNQ